MFLKLVAAIPGNHNFTPLSNQRNDFAEGLFVGLPVYFIQVCFCNHCHPWPSVITSRLVADYCQLCYLARYY